MSAVRRCPVCGRRMVQQYPNDPERDRYWYCRMEGLFEHMRAAVDLIPSPPNPQETP